ncbi:carboxypeptidase-like regulatory domain-containing protein [Hymenobacter sp. BT664]|uniref:Carboxypeptidase-like regulatory domain-containing protein n=1 Tax=Hymenobacter montanus TaxID=2771359 RepID=A0A927BBU2_9BACT|nr:carboxypeptidase regulatory-like domain-containing protein [Hymenobacter montanus]MBD2767238.1 carboxypeptidase-like regulatory domain-containing protein [Hymenobacter montanus]
MRFIFAPLSLYALLTLSSTAYGQARTSFDQSTAIASTTEIPRPTTTSAETRTPGSATVLRGTVKCPEGLLPGAVIHVNGTRTYVVSNATGDFELTIPDSTTNIEVTCSFAGFRDVVQHLRVKASSPATIVLDKITELPPPDRSAETGWW